MLILFIRHGRTDWNAARRIQGRTDIPLSESGRREQAERSIPDEYADAPAFSSPLVRANETASLLGRDAPEIADFLLEMDFGAWEGKTHAALMKHDPVGMRSAESEGLDMRPPGGETPREVQARLLSGLQRLSHDRMIAFTHKGLIRAAFAAALEWDMTDDLSFRVDWQAGQVFRFDGAGLTLVQANLSLKTS